MTALQPISARAAPQLLADSPPAAAVIDIAGSEHPVADVRSVVAATGGRTRIIAVGTVNDVSLYRALRDAGAADYLVKPFAADQIAAVLARSGAAETGAETAPRRPRSIFVTGARGGAGATTFAINAAWQLAQGSRVALLDLDLAFGSVALALDLEPSHGLHEILENPDRVDALFVTSAAARLGESLSVLAGEDAPCAIAPAAFERLMAALADSADCIVADAPRSLLAQQPALLAHADTLVIVTELNLVSARDVARITALAREAAPACTIALIANKSGKGRGEIDADAFARGARVPFARVLPWDPAGAKAAANAGQPLGQAAPSSALRRGIAAAAQALLPQEAEAKPIWRRLLNVRPAR